MPRKRKTANPRHPADAMAKFDRLLDVMAPKVIPSEPVVMKMVKPRGRRLKAPKPSKYV